MEKGHVSFRRMGWCLHLHFEKEGVNVKTRTRTIHDEIPGYVGFGPEFSGVHCNYFDSRQLVNKLLELKKKKKKVLFVPHHSYHGRVLHALHRHATERGAHGTAVMWLLPRETEWSWRGRVLVRLERR